MMDIAPNVVGRMMGCSVMSKALVVRAAPGSRPKIVVAFLMHE